MTVTGMTVTGMAVTGMTVTGAGGRAFHTALRYEASRRSLQRDSRLRGWLEIRDESLDGFARCGG